MNPPFYDGDIKRWAILVRVNIELVVLRVLCLTFLIPRMCDNQKRDYVNNADLELHHPTNVR